MPRKMSTPNEKDERTRNWTFLVYPDSAPANWQSIMDGFQVQWIESPLHDKDVNEDGTPKKPHWHVIVAFEGNKSYTQVLEFTKALNAPIPEKVRDMNAAVRYMAHLDHKDKYQYPVSGIIGHGGVDTAKYIAMTSTDRCNCIAEMQDWVDDEGCTEFWQMMKYARREKRESWYRLLCENSAYIMGEYVKSRRHWIEKCEAKGVDPVTGEVV